MAMGSKGKNKIPIIMEELERRKSWVNEKCPL